MEPPLRLPFLWLELIIVIRVLSTVLVVGQSLILCLDYSQVDSIEKVGLHAIVPFRFRLFCCCFVSLSLCTWRDIFFTESNRDWSVFLLILFACSLHCCNADSNRKGI